MAYVITDSCLACGSCAAECPNDAIKEGSIYKITDACLECGTCMGICPVSAIKEE